MDGEMQAVVVTDIRMSFGSMVSFMVKWAFASIPAMVFLFMVGLFLSFLVGGFGGFLR